MTCLGKCNHVGAFLLALEDFKREKLKSFCRVFDGYISNVKATLSPDALGTKLLSNWNVPCDSSVNLAPIDKTHLKKLNLETILREKLYQKLIAMTQVYQMINILIIIV